MSTIASLRQRARLLKADTYALYLAYRDPRTPWYARLFAACVVAYAISPIDLIPDFVPVLGYVDDLMLVPLGMALAVRMIPAPVMTECRQGARDAVAHGKLTSRAAALMIVVSWAGLAIVLGMLLVPRFAGY